MDLWQRFGLSALYFRMRLAIVKRMILMRCMGAWRSWRSKAIRGQVGWRLRLCHSSRHSVGVDVERLLSASCGPRSTKWREDTSNIHKTQFRLMVPLLFRKCVEREIEAWINHPRLSRWFQVRSMATRIPMWLMKGSRINDNTQRQRGSLQPCALCSVLTNDAFCEIATGKAVELRGSLTRRRTGNGHDKSERRRRGRGGEGGPKTVENTIEKI